MLHYMVCLLPYKIHCYKEDVKIIVTKKIDKIFSYIGLVALITENPFHREI